MSAPPNKAIDPARVGLSKSLMTGVCDRKSYYGETVRDANGRRLPFVASESMLFGKAIDVAHGYIVWHIREGREYQLSDAMLDGLEAARADADGWAALPSAAAFIDEVRVAIHKFHNQENGLDRLMPLIPGIAIQGNDGETLRAGDVIGTPDYMLADGSPLDVKTSKYGTGQWSYDESAFTSKAEMPIYALLSASINGAIPPRLIYQTYVRSRGGYWMWAEVEGTAAHVELGRLHAAHWRAAIKANDPDLLSFNTKWCGDCQFARPMPDIGFEGCAVGGQVRTFSDGLEGAA